MSTNYGLGGVERKVDDGGAGISEIPFNRTLFVEQLSEEEPYMPEVVTGLRTVSDVFEKFKPTVGVTFEDEDGNTTEEEMRFGSLADFGPQGIAKQSKFLASVKNQGEQYNSLVKAMKSKAALQTVLQKPELKEAFAGAIRAMLEELETSGR